MGIDITILFDKENVKLVNALNTAIIGQGSKVIKPNTNLNSYKSHVLLCIPRTRTALAKQV